MKREIPSFYDRYKNKFPSIIDALTIINKIAIECGLEELFLNGNKGTNYFGGCDECRSVLTYQVQATSNSLRYNNKPPMIVEFEKGYNYQLGGNPDYFINFRVQKQILDSKYDELMEFFDKCFSELTGSNYNLVLEQDLDDYVNLVYVPIHRQEFTTGSNQNMSTNPMVWLISNIVNNGTRHKYFEDCISSSVYNELSSDEKALIELYTDNSVNSTSELLRKIIKRLDNEFHK